MDKTVVELFAGVGGFRVGLNSIVKIDKNGRAIENGNFKFVWANQWEPSTKSQHAFDCYTKRFGSSKDEASNCDISKVNKKLIPNHTLLVGGFPCQDYSVARSLKNSKGIQGKKGVLWWQIYQVLKTKKPHFVLLENVDRLLKSPASQRGRDFAIMLSCFSEAGYTVEWRVINAADYGMPQRRRRLYIFASKSTTEYSKNLSKSRFSTLFNKVFPCKLSGKQHRIEIFDGYKDLADLSDRFEGTFENAGLMYKKKVITKKVEPLYEKGIVLKDIIQTEKIDKELFLDKKKREKIKFLRSSKKILRTSSTGHKYYYSEGSMSPFDSLDLPARTMLTSEGTTNRSSHVIIDNSNNKMRFLSPIECERINQFPDNWTNTGMSYRRRYFVMGNALVCGVIERIGKELSLIIDNEK